MFEPALLVGLRSVVGVVVTALAERLPDLGAASAGLYVGKVIVIGLC